MTDAELFDISDVETKVEHKRGGCEVRLIFHSQTSFNLIKTYLALEQLLRKIEGEIGIMAEAEGEH